MTGKQERRCLTYLDFFHLLKGIWDHAKLQTDQRDVALDTRGTLVYHSIVVFQDSLGLDKALKSLIEIIGFLLHFGESDSYVCQEFSV